MDLAVFGPNMGSVIQVEVSAIPVEPGKGKVITTGVVDEEEMGAAVGGPSAGKAWPGVRWKMF